MEVTSNEAPKKFCRYCESRGGVHKKDCTRMEWARPKDAPPKTEPPAMSFVSKEEFDGLRNQISTFQESIVEVLNRLTKDKEEVQTREPREFESVPTEDTILQDVSEDSSAPKDDEVPLSPSQQAIFQRYFDPEDGFKTWLVMDDKIAHMIDVPRKFSKASSAHWNHYKRAIHQKVLPQGDILGGIERHCQLVAQNLNYNRQLATK